MNICKRYTVTYKIYDCLFVVFGFKKRTFAAKMIVFLINTLMREM